MAHTALTQEQFLQKAQAVHGDKYDLSKVAYICARDKILVVCPKHGEFQIRARKFTAGQGCALCKWDAKRISVDEFIKRAQIIHNNKYDYRLVEFTTVRQDISIICPIHGVFVQRAQHHLSGCGCIQCAGTYKCNREEFIARSRKKHGDKYDYSNVVYETNKSRVKIICPIHGQFIQAAYNHTSGKGCGKCNNSKGEAFITAWLDYNKISYHTQKRFIDCVDKQQLPFDFCIYNKDGSIKTLLEYDGEQHYKPFRKNDNASLTLTQYHDAIKNQYCEDHKIPLIRIPYWDRAKLPEILQKYIGDTI